MNIEIINNIENYNFNSKDFNLEIILKESFSNFNMIDNKTKAIYLKNKSIIIYSIEKNKNKNIIKLISIFTNKKEQKKGYFTLLLNFLLKKYNNNKYVILIDTYNINIIKTIKKIALKNNIDYISKFNFFKFNQENIDLFSQYWFSHIINLESFKIFFLNKLIDEINNQNSIKIIKNNNFINFFTTIGKYGYQNYDGIYSWEIFNFKIQNNKTYNTEFFTINDKLYIIKLYNIHNINIKNINYILSQKIKSKNNDYNLLILFTKKTIKKVINFLENNKYSIYKYSNNEIEYLINKLKYLNS